MAADLQLTPQQQRLAEDHLHIVRQAIHAEIIVNETIFGFEYDDIYQEGCVWLCKAAACFQPEMDVKFATFARKVVSNGLRTYCRLMCSKQKRLITLPSTSDPDDSILAMDQFPSEDRWHEVLAQMDCEIMLERLKQQYTGSIRLGIDAIRWKAQGYTGTQIAAMYGVKPNMVGACISRAAKKLKHNSMFTSWMEELVAKNNI